MRKTDPPRSETPPFVLDPRYLETTIGSPYLPIPKGCFKIEGVLENMITANKFSVKSLGECVAGELVRVISHERIVFALVLADADDNRVHIGLLSPVNEAGRLYNYKANANRIVLSYGTNWFLKPLPSEAVTWPGNNRALHNSGRLTISRDGYCLRFSALPDDPYGDDAILNLSQSTIVDAAGQDPMPFRGFAIWEDEAASLRNDNHLLEVKIEADA